MVFQKQAGPDAGIVLVAADAQSRQSRSAKSQPPMTKDSVWGLPSAEQFLDIRQLQFHIGRAAVIALAGVRGVFHLAQ
jgi:hypothetical protein